MRMEMSLKVAYWACPFPGSSKRMALCEYDDQLVPTLIPCSAASFRLKKMRLPRMQSSVGLPRAPKIVAGTSDQTVSSATMAKTETHIALHNNFSSSRMLRLLEKTNAVK